MKIPGNRRGPGNSFAFLSLLGRFTPYRLFIFFIELTVLKLLF